MLLPCHGHTDCCLLTASAFAQESGAANIQRAMSAAPDTVSARAVIMDTDGATLRAGNNGWTCMPSVMPATAFCLCGCNEAFAAYVEVIEGDPGEKRKTSTR